MAFGETAEVAMDYDWLWLILAVGVLAPVGFVPAMCWLRPMTSAADTSGG